MTKYSGAEYQAEIDRRDQLRREIDLPCLLIPVLAEGYPDRANLSVGNALDISPNGVGFEIAGDNNISTNHVMFGLEDVTGEMAFTSAHVRFLERKSESRRIGAEFLPHEQQLLKAENIVPRFDPGKLQFRTGLATDVLQAWEECGVLAQDVHDRILVCPQCQALPTWRHGCPTCGSADTAADQLIHHYACAFIGPTGSFEVDQGLRCPKCLTRDLVVGADFEFLEGPQRCGNCGWTDSRLGLIANCLACGLRFPGHQALEETLNGYNVNRLDPLVYLA